MRYRVKLYGYMRSDDEAFAQKLAVVLALDASAVRLLLRDVPVVVREGLEESEANKLREFLTTIGALSLLEPMEDEEASTIVAAGQLTATGPAELPEAPKLTKKLPPVLWPGLILGALAFGLVFAVLSIWSSYTRMSQSYRPALRSSEPAKPEEKPAQPPLAGQAKSLEQLYAETAALERNIEHLRFLADIKEQEMRAVVGAYRADRDVEREKTIQWEIARRDLDAQLKQLHDLKATAEKLEGKRIP